jgi:uncharacterized membrane protein
MAKKETAITGGTVLAVLIAIYFINQICMAIFLPLLIISIVGLVVVGVMTYNQTDYLVYAWIAVAVLIILTIVSYGCGYGFYSTEIGKTLVDAGNTSYDAVNTIKEAEQTAEDVLKNVSKQVIDETINATNPSDPNIQVIGDLSKQVIDAS